MSQGPALPADYAAQKQDASPPVLLSKTCQNCFMLKIRCDRTQRNDICDRCARLGKHCVFRPARRRDNSAKRDSRIQALEQQVQDLLRTQKPGPVTQQALPTLQEGVTSAESSASGFDAPPTGDVVDAGLVSAEQADTLVDLYKTEMMPHYPFVHIPPHVTGRTMRHDKPFLFVAILSVSSFHDHRVQESLVHRFKYLVSEKVLLGGDDNLVLEYVQGLLVALAWNHYHKGSAYYSQYLQLCISVAVDMRLDRKSVRAKPTNPGSKRNPLWDLPNPQWMAEEQRAAAGLFYLSSTISRLLDKMNTFHCTHYIEEGCLTLRQRAEFKTDKDLYHVIRLQRIIDRIDTLANPAHSDHEAQTAYLNTLAELDEFRSQLIADACDSHFLFMQYHTAKLFLYQAAFFERSLQHNISHHVSTLCEGLQSAKAFMDLYIWLPPKSELKFTNSEWMQLSFGLTLAAKFAVVSKDPSVEQQTRECRQQLNIDNLFRHFELRIGALVGLNDDGTRRKDIFAHYENRVRRIKTWYERMCRATGVDTPSTQSNAQRLPPQHQQIPQSQPQIRQSQPQVPQDQPQMHTQHMPHHPHPSHSTTAPVAPAPAYVQQQNMTYPTGPTLSTTDLASVGMTTLSPQQYNATGYSPVPSLAFPDLMNAPGWDNPYDIPMMEEWMYTHVPNMPQHVQQMGLGTSPGSDVTWGSSPAPIMRADSL